MRPQFIPSPGIDAIGPIRIYALCILVGMAVAVIWSLRRWKARGGASDSLETILVFAVGFGIVGARLYHVITDWQLYFAPGRNPWEALNIRNGGLGIWGAVALGAVGAWLGCRRVGARFWEVADTVAPTLLVAQGIGRLGNWFNQELFGRPTTLPWALEIAPQYRPVGYESFATFHPTFLYELLWNFAGAALLVWLSKRFRLGQGKVFWTYVAIYTAGRLWIEHLRIDNANKFGGFRLNEYTSVIVLVASLLILAWLFRYRPGQRAQVEPRQFLEGDVDTGADVASRPSDAAYAPAAVESLQVGVEEETKDDDCG